MNFVPFIFMKTKIRNVTFVTAFVTKKLFKKDINVYFS